MNEKEFLELAKVISVEYEVDMEIVKNVLIKNVETIGK